MVFLGGFLNPFLEWLYFSQADKDHLRLAAAHAVLRISKSYYTQISPQLFYSTVLCAKVINSHILFATSAGMSMY
jgi:hypothetical protein